MTPSDQLAIDLNYSLEQLPILNISKMFFLFRVRYCQLPKPGFPICQRWIICDGQLEAQSVSLRMELAQQSAINQLYRLLTTVPTLMLDDGLS
jgi:hypothetical protein